MKYRILSVIVLSMPMLSLAGYSEYKLIDFSTCQTYTLTTDASAPEPNSDEASQEYKNDLIKNNITDLRYIWGIIGSDNENYVQQWANCNWQTDKIQCTAIGYFPYRSFTCPIEEHYRPWSRSCDTTEPVSHHLMIYSVDVAEYEDGGSPWANQYFQDDLKKMELRCHAAKKSNM